MVVAAVLLVLGCTTTEPEPGADPLTEDEQFLADVETLRDSTSEDVLLETAQEACFELETHVKTRRDFRLFYRVFSARGVVSAADAPLLLAAAMKHYCPSMERLRPDSNTAV